MNYDPVVLGKGCVLDGSEVGKMRPNDNVLCDGISGCGKTTSLLLPSIGKMVHMNPIGSFAKEEDAFMTGRYTASKKYQPWYLNVGNPFKGTHSFDPISYLLTESDVEGLSTSIVMSVLKKTVDDFWNTNSIQLLDGIIDGVKMMNPNAGMAEVLDLFDKTDVPDYAHNGNESADGFFARVEIQFPNSKAVSEYRAWRAMPEKTAASVRATLKGALNAVFPADIRNTMRNKPQVDFERLGSEKIALFVISDATENWQEHFTNLFWYTCIKELKRVAGISPGHHLIRPVRMYFDDMACSSPIHDLDKNVSLMRSYGVSFFFLLQSQTQLERVYGAERASIIRQNCPVQCYFPGGFDDRSCEIVSKRMNISYEGVLYSKMGKVFVMASGRKPVIVDRYDTFNSQEYHDYLAANGLSCREDIDKYVAEGTDGER